MATHNRAELPVIFDCNPGEDGLAEFDAEAQRSPLWLREDAPAVDVQRAEPAVVPPAPRRWRLALLVLLAGLSAGVVASWFGVGTGSSSRPSAAPPAASKNAVPDVPNEAPRAVAVAPPVRASDAVPTASTAPPTAPPADPVTTRIDPALELTLARVSEAYRARDAQSLAAVWPGADTAALERAFADLKYQTLSFDHCAVRPAAASSAVAICNVVIATAAKTGDPALQRRHESWTLLLDRSGDGWTVTGASVR